MARNPGLMSAPPHTVLVASHDEAERIRNAVRAADVAALGAGVEVANLSHVGGLVDLLSDPRVAGPIYDLPRPVDARTIADWVEEAASARSRGEGLLVVTLDEGGGVASYSRFTIWPDRASGEIAGARRADRQNSGEGRAGAARSFGWMFEVLGLRLIGVTAATDNVRSARVIEAAGFRDMGERISVRPDGSGRLSRCWELSREEWAARSAGRDETGKSPNSTVGQTGWTGQASDPDPRDTTHPQPGSAT